MMMGTTWEMMLNYSLNQRLPVTMFWDVLGMMEAMILG